MGDVVYAGLKLLETRDKDVLNTLVLKHVKKLDRITKNSKIRFHVKMHEIGGRAKYSFHVKINLGKDSLNVEASDWDMRRTVHMAMDKLITAVEHKIHSEGQQQQKFHPKKAKRGFGKNVKLNLRKRKKEI